jgi:hypothetical protein
MVSSLFADALANPTGVLDRLHKTNGDQSDKEFSATVAAHFEDIFKAAEHFQQVSGITIQPPSLRLHVV